VSEKKGFSITSETTISIGLGLSILFAFGNYMYNLGKIENMTKEIREIKDDLKDMKKEINGNFKTIQDEINRRRR
jgi:hypothetical protein